MRPPFVIVKAGSCKSWLVLHSLSFLRSLGGLGGAA